MRLTPNKTVALTSLVFIRDFLARSKGHGGVVPTLSATTHLFFPSEVSFASSQRAMIASVGAVGHGLTPSASEWCPGPFFRRVATTRTESLLCWEMDGRPLADSDQ